MVGNYERLGLTIRDILSEFNWNILYFMYHNHGKDTGRGNSDCSFTLSAVHRHVGKKETYMDAFDEEISSRADYLRILTKAKTQSRSELCDLARTLHICLYLVTCILTNLLLGSGMLLFSIQLI